MFKSVLWYLESIFIKNTIHDKELMFLLKIAPPVGKFAFRAILGYFNLARYFS